MDLEPNYNDNFFFLLISHIQCMRTRPLPGISRSHFLSTMRSFSLSDFQSSTGIKGLRCWKEKFVVLRTETIVCVGVCVCHLPLHLGSIISIEALSYSKWTAGAVYFLASKAGARIIKRFQFQCLPNSSLPVTNY